MAISETAVGSGAVKPDDSRSFLAMLDRLISPTKRRGAVKATPEILRAAGIGHRIAPPAPPTDA